jgi:hypothetical protein
MAIFRHSIRELLSGFRLIHCQSLKISALTQTTEQTLKRHRAEELGHEAVNYLVETPDQLYAFLNMSGLTPDNIRLAPEDKVIRLSALEFIGADETLAKEFSRVHGLKPGELQQALAILDPHGSTAW